MKRKSASRLPWPRVSQRRFAVRRVDEPDFRGHLTLLHLDAVRAPLEVPWGDGHLRIADTGFAWSQHFPDAAQHTLTTMFDGRGAVVQWYIDICARHGLDEAGVPWWDDLYLDIIVPTSGPAVLRDAEELAEAVRQGQVSADEAALAWREADRLLDALARGQFPLLAISRRHRVGH